jgi:membrane protein
MRLLQKLSNSRSFITNGIWDLNYEKAPWYQRLSIYLLRIISMIAYGASEHKLLVRSTALAYTTLLSIVPLLAVSFSIFKAFGGLEGSMGKIQTFIISNLTPGTSETITTYLNQFMARYHSGAVGGVGFVVLLLTVIALLTSIEKAFNEIWGIQKNRGFIRRFTSYWALITIGPVLLGLSITITASMQSSDFIHTVFGGSGLDKFLFGKVPYLVTIILFTVLYLIMPNTKVHLKSAFVGGVVGAFLWETAKWGYTLYAANMITYSKIYGSMAALPLFLVWTYYSWIVVLIGAEVAFAYQNIQTYKYEKQEGDLSYRHREFLSLLILSIIGRNYEQDRPAISSMELVHTLAVPVRVVRDILFQLEQGGFIVDIGEDNNRKYTPAKPLEHISVQSVLDYLQNYGGRKITIHDSIEKTHIDDLFKKIETSIAAACSDISLAQIAREMSRDGEMIPLRKK